MSVAAVVPAYGCGRCESGGLALPVAEQGGGTDDERGAGGDGVGLVVQVQSEQGDGLAQAHVVGETAAEAECAHLGQPGQAPLLVLAQRGLEGGGLGHGGAGLGIADTSDQVAEHTDRRTGDPVAVPLGLAGQCGAQRLHGAERFHPAALGAGHQLRVGDHPLVAKPDEGTA